MNDLTPFPTGTITFLFSDIEGSTRLWEKHPDAMRSAVAQHDTILQRAVDGNGGCLFKKTGDGIAAAFALAADALAAALSAQQALSSEQWPENTILCSRMGLHTGAAELRDGDYFGQTLNRTARLMDAGHGGQTLLSDATRELTRDCLPPEVSLLPMGEHRLKDLAHSETIYQLLHPSLAADFPPLRTLDNPDTPNNLPQQVTSFVGRGKEIKRVEELLGKTRLLTLTGSGGSGKTRLGLQAAADVLDGYVDGAWLVELASLSDPSLVPQTVAAAVGVKEQPGQSIIQTLTNALKPRHLLLVLDNCEHLVSACGALVAKIIRACPNIKVLTTSREPLGIAGETIYRVPTLSLPNPIQAKAATPETLSQFESVRLFIERAQAVKPDFAVSNANAPALAQICYRLDGIPLALELAAARVRSLSVEQINDKLDRRFHLLTGGDKAALPRQQTLRALIDWSYDLLSDSEKTLLARLSIFAGGWTLDAAEAIIGFEPVEDWQVVDLLTNLADKSLVLAEEQSDQSNERVTVRYRMLETIRQYAAERLSAGGEIDDVAMQHQGFFVALGQEAAPQLTGPEQGMWLNRLETEHDNLRAALDACAVGAKAEEAEAALAGLRLSAALLRFWWVRGYLNEGREQLARALTVRSCARNVFIKDEAQVQRVIAAALQAGGNLAWSQGDYPAARSLQEESLSLSRGVGDRSGIANALNNLGNITLSQGDSAAAGSLFEESLSLFREIGDTLGIAWPLTNLGTVAFQQGKYKEARMLHEEGLKFKRAVGNKRGIAYSLSYLGSVAFRQSDLARARALHEECLSLFREISDKRCIACCLDGMASVCAGEGNTRRALLLWATALTLRESIGVSLSPTDQAELDAEVVKVRAEMGAEAFAVVWEEDRALSWERAVEFASR